jgi:hypothetical protein
MTPRAGLVAVSLCFLSCADPRTAFVGTWKGPLTTVVRFRDGATETYPKGTVTIVISAPDRSDQLQFNGKCSMTATVKDDRTFSINRKACPPERIDPEPGVTCELSETVSGGSGTLEQSSLTLSYFGESQIARCTDGVSGSATYTASALLSE